MSWFSSKSDDGVQNFYPVTSYKSGYGSLSEKDNEWACTSNAGFQTETHTYYSILSDGSFLMCQVIWSYVGVFLIPATTQFTFKHYDPHTKITTWKSINASGFKIDGKNCKSEQFEIKHSGSAATEESYTITGNLDKKVQLSVVFNRPANAPGFKFGEGDDGGISTFGKEREEGKRDGTVSHKFHPLMTTTGSLILDGKVVDAKGDGVFIHAIQGMRPDTVASRWNFAYFSSGGGNEDGKLGSVRAIQMELETTDSYGPKGPRSGRTKVNIGCVYTTSCNPAPFLAVGQTTPADAYPSISTDESSAKHLATSMDKDTGYAAPTGIEFKWAGERKDGKGKTSAKVTVDKLGVEQGQGGLIEKVDVLAEIPYVIRKGFSMATGTKPYIYQYHNPTTLEVDTGDEVVQVKGWLFNEASFVSA